MNLVSLFLLYCCTMKWLQTRSHSKVRPRPCQKFAATGNVEDANNTLYWAPMQMVSSFKTELTFLYSHPKDVYVWNTAPSASNTWSLNMNVTPLPLQLWDVSEVTKGFQNFKYYNGFWGFFPEMIILLDATEWLFRISKIKSNILFL